jgi:hypothetical protein
VLQSYTGFQTSLENVLYGSIANMPTYQDGTLTVRDNAVVFLEGNGSYEFMKLELIATADGEEIYHYDLLGNTGGVIAAEESDGEDASDDTATDGEPMANTDRVDETVEDAGNENTGNEDAESMESDAETALDQETQTANPENTADHTSAQEPVSGFSTERELNLTYALPAGTAVRIYLTATTEDGYQFTYDLFNGVTSEDEENEFGFAPSENYFADNYAVYDKKQNVYFIQ